MTRPSAIFIAGSSRSGTTMLGRILGRHPDVFTFHELHFFESIWDPDTKERSVTETESREMLRLLAHRQVVNLYSQPAAGEHAERVERAMRRLPARPRPVDVLMAFLTTESEMHGAAIPCEQTPRNAAFAAEILELLPSARIVWMVRDPRSVLLSQKNKWKRSRLGFSGELIGGSEANRRVPASETMRSFFNYHPWTASRIWLRAARDAAGYREDPRVLVVRFEDLLADANRVVREVCAFLELEFSEDLLAVPTVGSSTARDEPDGRGVRPSFAGDWTRGGLDSFEMAACQRAAARWMAEFGYAPERVEPGRIQALKWAAWTPVHLLGACLLNLRRSRHPLRALRRRLYG